MAEYAYYEKERLKAKAELDRMDQKRMEDGERASEHKGREDEAKG